MEWVYSYNPGAYTGPQYPGISKLALVGLNVASMKQNNKHTHLTALIQHAAFQDPK